MRSGNIPDDLKYQQNLNYVNCNQKFQVIYQNQMQIYVKY